MTCQPSVREDYELDAHHAWRRSLARKSGLAAVSINVPALSSVPLT